MQRHPQTCTRCQGIGGYHKHVTTLSSGHEVRYFSCDHERDLSNDSVSDDEQTISDLTCEVMRGHMLLNEACGLAFAHGQLQEEHERCYRWFTAQERQLSQALEMEATYLDVISDLKNKAASCA